MKKQRVPKKQIYRPRYGGAQSSSDMPSPTPSPASAPTTTPQNDESEFFQNNAYNGGPPPFTPTSPIRSPATPRETFASQRGAQLMALLGLRSNSSEGPSILESCSRDLNEKWVSQPTEIDIFSYASAESSEISFQPYSVTNDEDNEEIIYCAASQRKDPTEETPASQATNQTEEDSNDLMGKMSAVQRSVDELMASHREMQKQMEEVGNVLLTKECLRLEKSFGRINLMRKYSMPHLKLSVSNCGKKEARLLVDILRRELPSIIENAMSNSYSTMGNVGTDAIIAFAVESTRSALSESLQKIVGDGIDYLKTAIESKAEATSARQIQTQFLTTGRDVLRQEVSSFVRTSLDPGFQKVCQKMVENFCTTLSRGIADHNSSVYDESSHLPLAVNLRDSMSCAIEYLKHMISELVKAQEQQARSMRLRHQGLVMPVGEDLRVKMEIAKLISQGRFEEAFTFCLQISDVSVVSWLCSQVDVKGICNRSPLVLSPRVLLCLIQQLSCDLDDDTIVKLGWMLDFAGVLDVSDPVIAPHANSILENVKRVLLTQWWSTTRPIRSEANTIRLLIRVFDSLMMTIA